MLVRNWPTIKNMDKTENILQLWDIRESEYSRYTIQILHEMMAVLDGIVAFNNYEPEKLIWLDVVLFDDVVSILYHYGEDLVVYIPMENMTMTTAETVKFLEDVGPTSSLLDPQSDDLDDSVQERLFLYNNNHGLTNKKIKH